MDPTNRIFVATQEGIEVVDLDYRLDQIRIWDFGFSPQARLSLATTALKPWDYIEGRGPITLYDSLL